MIMTAPSPSEIQPSSGAADDPSDPFSNVEDEETDHLGSSLLPPISAAIIDDEASLNIAFLSMQQLLGDPATSGEATDDAVAAATSALAPPAFEPSIVSGTTDLFEGDLGDDELPSIMRHHEAQVYENLQLDPDELVQEVQEEVRQAAAADPVGSAAVPVITTTEEPTINPTVSTDLRRPVVPFAVVRKLSDAQIVNEKCVSLPIKLEACQKRAAPPSPTSSVSAAKKTRTTAAAEGAPDANANEEAPSQTGRITRSRAKREGPVTEECLSSSPNKRAKKGKAPAAQVEKVSAAPQESVKSEPTASLPAKKPESEDQPVILVTKPTAPTPPPTHPVVVSDASADGTTKTIPVVTPVGSDDSVDERQRQMATKLKSPTTPCLPTLTKSATETTTTAPLAVAPKRPSRRSSASKSSKAAAVAAPKSPSVTPAAMVIDTSTAHVKALTGENGASVSVSVRNCTLLNDPDDEDDDKPAPATTTASNGQGPLTEEQRAQQSRDRNRKHARNTRLRKKAYVEELKLTLNELVAQRDQAATEKQQNDQRELEQREVRFRVMEEFLRLRGGNLDDTTRWSAILAPDFSITLPLTTFQTMVSSPTQDTSSIKGQTLTSVEEVMQDSCYFAAFLQTLGKNSNGTDVIYIEYQCDRNDFMMDDCNAVLGFNAVSAGAVDQGASKELTFRGTIRANFCPESNRLRSTEMIFDTGTIVDQRNAMLA